MRSNNCQLPCLYYPTKPPQIKYINMKINNPETKPAIQTGAWFFFSFFFFKIFNIKHLVKFSKKFRKNHLIYTRKIKHFQNVPNLMSKTDKICQGKIAGTHRCIVQSPVHICREWPLEMHCEKT